MIGARVVGSAFFAYPDTATIRREMEEAIPYYAGISQLEKEGDWVQWGGEQLCSEGFPNMPEGRARFTVPRLPDNRIPDGLFQVSTRRGKQFNSIVFRSRDAQMGNADRFAVLMASGQGFADGDRVVLSNETGTFEGTVKLDDVARRHLVLYWPEANVLLPRRYDPEAGIPDYNAFVRIAPA